MPKNTDLLLAGDIGGTKTNLAIVSAEAGPRSPLVEATFPSGNYDNLEALAYKFLNEVDRRRITRACFGVAGPVVAGEATITNLPWAMNETQLAEALDISSVHLLNDLVAIANAVPTLETGDLHTLNEGRPEPGGAIGIVAPGTGLGEAYLTWDGTRYNAYASEGGHADFAPTNATQVSLLQYLQERQGHVSFEAVCSGKGIPNIYDFLRDTGYAPEPAWLAVQLAEVEDRTPVIVNTALDEGQRCALCAATIEIFVTILGAEAGNVALTVLASGGVYLGGGMPPRMLSILEREDLFMAAFRRKGRLSELLIEIPVHVIMNSKAALLGAACYGLAMQ